MERARVELDSEVQPLREARAGFSPAVKAETAQCIFTVYSWCSESKEHGFHSVPSVCKCSS